MPATLESPALSLVIRAVLEVCLDISSSLFFVRTQYINRENDICENGAKEVAVGISKFQ